MGMISFIQIKEKNYVENCDELSLVQFDKHLKASL